MDLNHPAVQRALGTNLESTIGSRASPDSLQAQDQQNGLVSELEVQRKDDELPPYTGEVVLYLLTHCADCSLKIHGLQIVYKIPPAIQVVFLHPLKLPWDYKIKVAWDHIVSQDL